ncbi:MAG: hypothetical protein JWM68_1864, partial [Verrucomicrobiales bacterium]|nr:hypothetical protein [Verrucomicrobiales bacterium]
VRGRESEIDDRHESAFSNHFKLCWCGLTGSAEFGAKGVEIINLG